MAQALTEREGVRELARSLACECKVAAKAFGEVAGAFRVLAYRLKDSRGWPAMTDAAEWLDAAERALGNLARASQEVSEGLDGQRTEG